MKELIKLFSLCFVFLFLGQLDAQKVAKSGAFPYVLPGKTPNTSVECADYPEFAFFFPEMSGNLNFGIISRNQSKWIRETTQHAVKQKDRRIIYNISDPILGKGQVTFTVLPLQSSNGIVIEVVGKDLSDSTELFWSFGGGYAKELSRSQTRHLIPDYCKNNVFSVERSAFTMYYGVTVNLKVIMAVTPITSDIRLSDANKQSSPLEFFNAGKRTDAPALAAKLPLLNGKSEYFCFYRQNALADYNYFMLPALFHGLCGK